MRLVYARQTVYLLSYMHSPSIVCLNVIEEFRLNLVPLSTTWASCVGGVPWFSHLGLKTPTLTSASQ